MSTRVTVVSLFVCVCVSATALAPVYDVRARDWTYQSGLCWTLKVFNWRILLKCFVSRVRACFSFSHGQIRHLRNSLKLRYVTSSFDDHYLWVFNVGKWSSFVKSTFTVHGIIQRLAFCALVLLFGLFLSVYNYRFSSPGNSPRTWRTRSIPALDAKADYTEWVKISAPSIGTRTCICKCVCVISTVLVQQ